MDIHICIWYNYRLLLNNNNAAIAVVSRIRAESEIAVTLKTLHTFFSVFCFCCYKIFFACSIQEERVAISTRIQNAGTEVVEAKAGAVGIIDEFCKITTRKVETCNLLRSTTVVTTDLLTHLKFHDFPTFFPEFQSSMLKAGVLTKKCVLSLWRTE